MIGKGGLVESGCVVLVSLQEVLKLKPLVLNKIFGIVLRN
jgi:hypothetical protein